MGAPLWLREDKQAVIDHYPTGGAGAVRPHLKGTHSDIAIRGMAKRLGVKLGEEYRRKPVTKELLRDLERAYRSGKRGAIKALAERQGVNYDWLKNVAAEHGLSGGRKHRWHPDADAILDDCDGLCPSSVRARLRRAGFFYPISSIVARLQHRNISIAPSDAYTVGQLQQMLGVDRARLNRWIEGGHLKATRRTNYQGQTGERAYVTSRALRDFIVKHPSEFDLRRIAPAHQPWFIDLLTNKLADAS